VGRSDSATRASNASVAAGRLDHASGPPRRSWSWSTTSFAGGPDAISRLAGVYATELARSRPAVGAATDRLRLRDRRRRTNGVRLRRALGRGGGRLRGALALGFR